MPSNSGPSRPSGRLNRLQALSHLRLTITAEYAEIAEKKAMVFSAGSAISAVTCCSWLRGDLHDLEQMDSADSQRPTERREPSMNIALRAACEDDVPFARDLYFETMREIIEQLFGWDQSREEENFTRFFKLEEVRIITADGQNAGWIQEQISESSINLGSFYVVPAMQGRGIGTHVLRKLLERAGRESKSMTLAVVKTNPALQFYVKHGFRTTHEDEHKFYMAVFPATYSTDQA
jgi:GNAT superfamily N-acetyltransferase